MNNINESTENGRTTVFCTQCGKENEVGNSFCIYCGASIAAPDTKQSSPDQESGRETANNSSFNYVSSAVKTPLSMRQYISIALMAIAALVTAFGSFIRLDLKPVNQILTLIGANDFSLESFGIKTKYSLYTLRKTVGDFHSMLVYTGDSENASSLLTIKGVITAVLIVLLILSCLAIVFMIIRKEKQYRLTTYFLIGLAVLVPIAEFIMAKRINDGLSEMLIKENMDSSVTDAVSSIIGMGTSLLDLKIIKISAFTIIPLLLLLVALFLAVRVDKPLLVGRGIENGYVNNMRKPEQVIDMYAPRNTQEAYTPGKYAEGAGEYSPGKYSSEESTQTGNQL